MNKLATIEQIEEISEHFNADSLELAKVMGYTVIVPKGKYKVGDTVALIHPDTILPSATWAEPFKKYAEKRVKALKLRGVYSFGIIVDLAELSSMIPFWENVGDEISEFIGVTKYTMPEPQELNAKGNLPFGIFRTDEQRYNNFRNGPPYGEVVDVTLKLDGCLDAETLVDTERGPLTIEHIVENNLVGLKVTTLDVLTGNFEDQEILSTSVKDNYGKEWFELETENGAILRITGNHRVFLPELGCWRRTDQLKENDEIVMLS